MLAKENPMTITNIMSVDLEDNYCDMPFSTWSRFDSRIHITTKVILDLFEKYHVNATFFTVGHIAQKHPGLIENIKSKGTRLQATDTHIIMFLTWINMALNWI